VTVGERGRNPLRGRALAVALLLVAAVVLSPAPRARATDPLDVVRAFLEADGSGARLEARTWARVAPLVAWRLEPAWDRVRLIRGYQVGTPILEGDAVRVEVEYTVAKEVTAGATVDAARVERVVFRLAPDGDGDGWRVLPPPPPPHLFASQVDAEELARLLDEHGSAYLSSSAFVWRMVRDAGWILAYEPVAVLVRSDRLAVAETPKVGDLAFYFDDDEAYHVGLVESQDRIVSATLNAGIRRAPVEAFAGRIEYRRLVAEPHETPAPPSPAPTLAATLVMPRRGAEP
jgi:hypothetical protein